MKPELHFCEYHNCKTCPEKTTQFFVYTKMQKGEKCLLEHEEDYSIIFILSGEVIISCNEFVNVRFQAGDIALCPVNSTCTWEIVSDMESIVFKGKPELPPCDQRTIRERSDLWLNAVTDFHPLPIKPRLSEYLTSLKHYMDDDIMCFYMQKSKLLELSMLFKAYYSPEELVSFFFPAIRYTHEFEVFVMNNYLKMKGVKEFVDLSGMNVSTFNRKFKAHFHMSPYQWLIKQKSKHIYCELSTTDKSLATIAKEFHFSDASHFNRYCKTMFGASPSKIREKILK